MPAASPEPLLERPSEAALLGKLFDRSAAKLSPETASYFLTLSFTEDEVSRMNELSDKAQLGVLTPPESAELDAIIHVANFLALVQSKARRSLSAAQ